MDIDYIRLAKKLASESCCVRRKVGAVLVTQNQKVVIKAVNNPMPYKTICSELGCLRQQLHIQSGELPELCRCKHCEKSLIEQCNVLGISTKGATIYTTLFPCASCTRILIDAEIQELIYIESYDDNRGLEQFRQANIVVHHFIT